VRAPRISPRRRLSRLNATRREPTHAPTLSQICSGR